MNISVIIPTYNRPELLREALYSCLSQTYKPFEILVGDDSLDKKTQILVSEISSSTSIPIHYKLNNPQLRQVMNVNSLVERASGDKILLLHDDDLLLDNALEVLKACFDRDKTVEVAYGKQYIIHNDGVVNLISSERFNKDFFRTSKFVGSVLTSLEAGLVQQIPNNAYLINSELIKSLKYRSVGDACDYEFGLRLGEKGVKLHFEDVYTSKYRFTDESISYNPMNDAGIVSFMLAKNCLIPSESYSLRDEWLKTRSCVAIANAIAHKKITLALGIYFSKYHYSKIITLGGIQRLTWIAQVAFKELIKKGRSHISVNFKYEHN